MSMGATEGIQKASKAGAAVAIFRIVKLGADDDHVLQGAAVGDGLVGVSQTAGPVAEDAVRVMQTGISKIEAGGTVTRGDKVTTDSVGRAVTAAPATGVNNNTIGIANVSAVIGDLMAVLLMPGQIQGA